MSAHLREQSIGGKRIFGDWCCGAPELVWHVMQEDLAARSPKGRLVTATLSSDYIQKLQPDLVLESFREVLSEARTTVGP